MRRGFDWYGLALPAILVVGAASVGISLLGNGEAFAVVGWILLGVGVLALPFWLSALIRSRMLLARAKREPGDVRFVGALLAQRWTLFLGLARLVAVVADKRGIRLLHGNPLAELENVPWTDVGLLAVGDYRVGRTLVPTMEIGNTVIRILHDNGWTASFRYADAILAELVALRRRADSAVPEQRVTVPPGALVRHGHGRLAGASQSPPSGGRVSSTDAGRPPQGSSDAITEP